MFNKKPEYGRDDLDAAVERILKLQSMWNSVDQYIRLNNAKLTKQGYDDLTLRLQRLSQNIHTAQLYLEKISAKVIKEAV